MDPRPLENNIENPGLGWDSLDLLSSACLLNESVQCVCSHLPISVLDEEVEVFVEGDTVLDYWGGVKMKFSRPLVFCLPFE